MMPPRLLACATARLPAPLSNLRLPRRRFDARALGRRLAHFWIVWSALLLVHEGGHAYTGWRQGLTVSRVTVGVGPVLWRGERDETEVVLRLVPIAGITNIVEPAAASPGSAASAGTGEAGAWGRQLATLGGGVLATLAVALAVAGLVAAAERGTGTRWRWGRLVVADAIVLTVFNLLPVPPLDGGRAVVGALAAWRGAPLSADALFWIQLGGLALAIVPMTLWTSWTARIDALALRWGAPAPAR